MNQQDLCKALAKRLRRDDIPPPLWELLEEECYLNDFWDQLKEGMSEKKALNELYQQASRLLEFHQRMSTHEMGSNCASDQAVSKPDPYSDLLETNIDEYVIERNKAMAAYRRRLAEDNDAVRNFRATVLDDQILSPDQAKAFLASKAADCMTIDNFRTLGIPVIGHHAEIVDKRFAFEHKNIIDKLVLDNPNFNKDATSVGRICFKWGDRETIIQVEQDEEKIPYVVLECVYYEERYGQFCAHATTVHPTSVLAKLQKAGELLSASTLWKTAEATWFIMTDELPDIWNPIKNRVYELIGKDFHFSYIDLTIESWMPPQIVERYYRKLQQILLKKGSYRTQIKHLKLFRFVQEQKGLSWEKLCQKWNNEYPEVSYRNTRNFQRDYKRVKEKLLFPYR